jgi:hypothetical protein
MAWVGQVVAAQIGVMVFPVWNWWHGLSVNHCYLSSKILSFLRYKPIPTPDDALEKLVWYEQVNSLTLQYSKPKWIAIWNTVQTGLEDDLTRCLRNGKSFNPF